MPKTYRISKGNEFVIVTVDESGAYIIKDSAGHKVFFSKRQAELMKLGMENLIKNAFADADEKDVKIEEIKE
ncbi:MAG: hypothetical protein ACP5MX_00585 [Candidatus Micrarchaeia archaeon]